MFSTLNYDFLAPGKIVFGWGRRSEVGLLGRTLGRRAFIISGLPENPDHAMLGEIIDALHKTDVETHLVAHIHHEPQVEDVDKLSMLLRQKKAAVGDFILGVGGGAAIDLAKAVAAMATNDQSPTVKDYLENVGRDLKIVNPPLPVMAMPATAATGAEATKNAVISSYDPPFKKSLRDEGILPKIALIDPQLTVSVPAHVTATGGMDAITQLFESFISRKARPIPQTLSVQGLMLAMSAIVEAVEYPESRSAREAMSHAALLSGIALANSGLGMAHGVAAALGIHCHVPHGLACALMLPATLRTNSTISRDQLAFLSKMLFTDELTGNSVDPVEFLVERVEKIIERIGIPRWLSEIGVKREQIPALVISSRGSSMSGNPREISDAELADILESLL